MDETAPPQPLAPAYKYWAFISYSHRDKQWADWLHKSIETFKVPARLVGRPARTGPVPQRLFPVFRDRDELPTSGNLGTNIEEALLASRYMIVICSPHAAASRWVNEEITAFKKLGREDCILCLIVEGEPNASDKADSAASECFPQALRYKAAPDGTPLPERSEPIAADARPGQDGKDNSRLKVLAGLLGVGFDELRQRDEERRRQQRAWTAGVALAVAGLLVGSWAWQERVKNRQMAQQLAIANVLRAQRLAEQGDDATAAAFAAEANHLWPSHLAHANALAFASDLAVPTRVLSQAGVRVAVFSPDGDKVLTSGRDDAARLWDARTGEPLGEPMKHGAEITALAFSPDGKLVASASRDKTAHLWDSRSGKPLGKALQHPGAVTAIAFSPDGTQVLTGDPLVYSHTEGSLFIWAARTGELLGKAGELLGPLHTVAFAPDGKSVLAAGAGADVFALSHDHSKKLTAKNVLSMWEMGFLAVFNPDGRTVLTVPTGYKSRSIELWEARTGKIVTRLPNPFNRVKSIAFSPDGKTVLVVEGNNAHIVDPATGVVTGAAMRHLRPVRTAVFSPDGRTVLTASDDSTARLWDAETGEPIGRILMHESKVQSAVFDHDGATILTVTEDGTARLWSARTGRAEAASFQALDGENARFSADGKTLLLSLRGARSGTAWLRTARTGKMIGRSVGDGHGQSFALSPRGDTVLEGTDQGTARLWDPRSGAVIEPVMRHAAGAEVAARFSPDGKWILTEGNGTARLWDAQTHQPVGQTLVLEKSGRAALAPDGINLKKAVEEPKYWDARTGKPRDSATKPEDVMTSLADSLDGTRALMVSQNGHYRLWDRRKGQPPGQELRPDGKVTDAAFSPDGSMLLTGSDSGAAQLWDGLSGTPLKKVMRHSTDGGMVVAFSPDGRTIVTASAGDKAVRFWDAATNEAIRGVPIKTRESGWIGSVAFAPDGETVLLRSSDGESLLSAPWLRQKYSGAEILATAQLKSLRKIDPEGNVRNIPFSDWLSLFRTHPHDEARPAPALKSEPVKSIIGAKDVVNDCTWVESRAVVSVEDQGTREQVHAAAVSQAERSALQDIRGVTMKSNPFDFEDGRPIGGIHDAKVIEAGFRDSPECPNCRYAVKLKACVSPAPAAAKTEMRVELTISRSRFIENEEAKLTVSATRDCYPFVYRVGLNGATTLIVPNKTMPEMKITAGQTWEYPDDAARKGGASLTFQLPPGTKISAETIRLVCATSPLTPEMSDPATGGFIAVLRRLNHAKLEWADDAQAFVIYAH